jgi:hypothetical protein
MAVKSLPASPSPAMDDYQAQDDLRTVQRAHEVLSTPKRHRAMKQHASKQLHSLKAIKSMSLGKR